MSDDNDPVYLPSEDRDNGLVKLSDESEADFCVTLPKVSPLNVEITIPPEKKKDIMSMMRYFPLVDTKFYNV